ncbi:MAG TPA: TonB-dependent receptor, partial [Candidatus Acidoferrum sp.]
MSALIAIVLVVSTCNAQTGTSSLRGTVLDKSGGVIVGAQVILSDPQQGFERTTTSGSQGEYEFLALRPGTYLLAVVKDGFQKHTQSNVQLLVNLPATQTITMEIGSSTQTVEVSATTETLNTTDATIGIAFNENQVKQLPLEGRNVPDLLSLQPGVAYTGNRADVPAFDTRNGAVNGARSDQSNVTLDGISVNDDGGNAFTSVLPVTLDSVQEFRVTTTNANADQGSSGGAQVALVTKSGTNDFHGSVYEYHRNTYTSANDYFVKQSKLQSGQPNVPPKLIRNIFGGS